VSQKNFRPLKYIGKIQHQNFEQFELFEKTCSRDASAEFHTPDI